MSHLLALAEFWRYVLDSTLFHYTCNTCDFSLDIDFVPRVYVFDDGRQLSMQQRHVWCTACDRMTVAESLVESPGRRAWFQERYQRQCENLANSELIDAKEKDIIQKSIEAMDEYQQLLIEWQSIRKRKPFCLSCGNTSIVVPESEFSPLGHPKCGGKLECVGSAQGGSYVGSEPHKYSVEGELIALGHKCGLFEGEKRNALGLWWPTKT